MSKAPPARSPAPAPAPAAVPPPVQRPAALVLPEALREALIAHAREGDPDEVCGVLAGTGQRVERVFRVRNAAETVEARAGVFRDRQTGQPAPGRRAVHYYMDPRDQFRVFREADDLGLDVLGFYHSHTHTEARPSPTDIRLATDAGTMVWVLVSLQDQARPDVRAWTIRKAEPTDETGDLQEVPIVPARPLD